MRKLFLVVILSFFTSAYAEDDIYLVESSVNPGNLIINGTQFAAKGFCYDYRLGDQVVFISGNPDGNCTEALIVNQRNNETCDVWCQYPL